MDSVDTGPDVPPELMVPTQFPSHIIKSCQHGRAESEINHILISLEKSSPLTGSSFELFYQAISSRPGSHQTNLS